MSLVKPLAIAVTAVALFTLATAAPAFAHTDQLDAGDVWTSWVPDPLAILLVFGFGYLYARGLRDWWPRSRPVHRWQVVSYYAGLAAMFIVLISPLDPLADHLFFVHQIQHLLLRIAGPVLILLGAPLTPILRGLPHGLRMSVIPPVVSNPLARRAYQWATHPVIIPALFLLVLYVWQFPLAHDAALKSLWVHYLMHLTMTVSSMLFWWLIIDPKPHRSRLHYGVRVLIMAVTILPNTVLGAFIVFAERGLYDGYGLTRPFSIVPLADQRWGGLIMWLSADMMTVSTAAVIFGMWYAREQQQTVRSGRQPAG